MNQLIKPLDFSKYTFRASSAGKICGKPKGKTPFQKYDECLTQINDLKIALNTAKNKETKTYLKNTEKLQEKLSLLPELEKNKDKKVLSETAISYLVDIYTETRYGVKKNIFGKYLDSGTARESESIKLLSDFDDELYRSYKDYCLKNNIPYRKFNEHVEGECDVLYPVIDPELVADVKSVWDMFTFQPHTLELAEHGGEDEVENDIYKWQGIVYCKLYNTVKFILAYCLVDMPDELIEDEVKRITYKFGKNKEYSPECQDTITEFIRKCKFDHIPIEARVIKFEFDYNEEDYNFLVGQIEMSREWLNDYSIKEWERENRKKWTAKNQEIAFEDIENKGESERFVDLVVSEISELTSDQESKFENIGDIKTEFGKIVCQKCQSENYHTYGEFGDFVCDDCQYDTGDEVEDKINPYKESDLLLEANNLTEIKSEKEIIINNPPKDTEPEIIQLIEKCQSREDCVELYTLKGAAYWTDNPEYKNKLTEKRNYLSASKPEPVKQTPAKKADPKPQPIQKPKPVFRIPTNDTQPGDLDKIASFKELYPTFTTVVQYKDLYISNREIIDRNLDFRSKFEIDGKNFALKLATELREKIQKEATGS